MPRLGPIKRSDLITYLHQLDFEGPFPGGKHQYMQRGDLLVHIPNPHRSDIDVNLLRRLLRQAGIDRETWEKL